MASRMMHLAVAIQLTDMLPRGMSIPRFLSGSIMVDSAPQARQASHFLVQVGNRKTYDVARFRSQYGQLLLTDGLALGYYLHLLQDLVFRDEMYHVQRFDPRRRGYLVELHRDYRQLNMPLAMRYGLTAGLAIPQDAAPLSDIAEFDMAGLRYALAEDFALLRTAPVFFLKEELADQYICRAVEVCRKELNALQTGTPLTDPMDWTWALDPE